MAEARWRRGEREEKGVVVRVLKGDIWQRRRWEEVKKDSVEMVVAKEVVRRDMTEIAVARKVSEMVDGGNGGSGGKVVKSKDGDD